MDWELGGLIVVIACVSGCDQKSPSTIGELEAAAMLEHAKTHPVGRYQYVRHYRYTEGIEYVCLDTTTGELGFATIPDDPKKVTADSFTCR